jgi:hypothetical protein
VSRKRLFNAASRNNYYICSTPAVLRPSPFALYSLLFTLYPLLSTLYQFPLPSPLYSSPSTLCSSPSTLYPLPIPSRIACSGSRGIFINPSINPSIHPSIHLSIDYHQIVIDPAALTDAPTHLYLYLARSQPRLALIYLPTHAPQPSIQQSINLGPCELPCRSCAYEIRPSASQLTTHHFLRSQYSCPPLC